MQTSYRWVQIGIGKKPPSMRELEKALMDVSESSSWFSNVTKENGVHQFTFFRKSEFGFNDYDPGQGLVHKVGSSTISLKVIVVASSDLLLLRIVNPGRSIRDLLDALESAFGFGFWAKQVRPDLGNIDALFAKFDFRRVVAIKLAEIGFSASCVGRLELASKEGIDLASLDLITDRSYAVESMKLDVSKTGVRGRITMARSGVVRASGDLAGHLVRTVEDDVLQQLRS